MNAVLLAAGFGSRLMPITKNIPKCLVTIKNRSLLEIWLNFLFDAGVDRVLINTHYLSGLVEDFVLKSEFQKKIILFHEDILLGTAGTLLANKEFFKDGPVFVAHADNLSKFNMEDFIRAHNNRPTSCNMTMMLFESDDPKSCGIVDLDEHGVVVDFHEKSMNPPSTLANAAVYIFEPELIFEYCSKYPRPSDISNELIPKNLGKIFTYLNNQYHRDIGTLESLRLANLEFTD